jgi:uncharacterized tellurite resistance protein B-like protein
MFDRLFTFLKSIAAQDDGPAAADPDDPRVAVAALLIHLMDADGVRTENEVGRLRALIGEAYGLSLEETEKLIAAGEFADKNAIDFYRFTKVVEKKLDREARRDFVAMMWEMVLADRMIGELEDHVLWRIAELIGIEQAERIAIRQNVRAGLPQGWLDAPPEGGSGGGTA